MGSNLGFLIQRLGSCGSANRSWVVAGHGSVCIVRGCCWTGTDRCAFPLTLVIRTVAYRTDAPISSATSS
ncbi:hypothetical protein BMONG18_1706 [Bifidobacterium mongoliense]|uniref:Uncharacterized protein n=1 Tax=Bifidobacterium mongoliense TaxID=518643 RepID=A0A423UBU4_9BIFI|nr:hypothetical protein BMONG18_1706 [Bifidobacterium mongoliense]